MKNCEVLKKFYEEHPVLINMVDNLVLGINKAGTIKENNMGGRHSGLEYRLICTTTFVQFKLFNDVFVLDYSVDFGNDKFECTQFYGSDLSSGINFGHVDSTDKIWVQDDTNCKVMQYPIQEEQYFQYLTMFDLSEQELYQYFVNLQKPNSSVIQLFTTGDSGFDSFESVLNNKNDMKTVTNSMSLVEMAYRRTLKI